MPERDISDGTTNHKINAGRYFSDGLQWHKINKSFISNGATWKLFYSATQCKVHANEGTFGTDGSYSVTHSKGTLFTLEFNPSIFSFYPSTPILLLINPCFITNYGPEYQNDFFGDINDTAYFTETDTVETGTVSVGFSFNQPIVSINTLGLLAHNHYESDKTDFDFSFSSGALKINGVPITNVELI